ncbi:MULTISPECIES: hypothetical protein [unclassified Imperialibacter]|uniref:hypothetical protein n=1 Tax=unclassified Imperialibacter TaxID=2629706 RepID=UPI00125186A5|nr:MULTISPECIES: hypothetical protein [unclassified Imperialibacter]CAD5285052.1 exported hypothetical protein [Imperialibacter sp. 75]CAD5296801.1 exported hypothetical protein [Imperialibacter sp. 89]VVT24119.1 exported hypothetical protein [Imperialibacter sp. EC-SDR9]
MKKSFYLLFLGLAGMGITACNSGQTSEKTSHAIVDEFISLRKSSFSAPNHTISKTDSILADGFTFYGLKESIQDSSSYYTVLFGAEIEGKFVTPDQFRQVQSQLVSIANIVQLIPGTVKEIEDVSGEGKNDFLSTYEYNRNGEKMKESAFWVRSDSITLIWAAEPQLVTKCVASCSEEDGGERQYPGDCIGTVTTYAVEGGGDGTLPQIVVTTTNILADARCNNWGNVASARVYQWLGDRDNGIDFIFLADRMTPEEELEGSGEVMEIDPDAENPLDLLADLQGLEIEMLTEKDGQLVRFLICGGGVPRLTFDNDDNGWVMRTVWYQDAFVYRIKTISAVDNTYTISTDNEAIPKVDFVYHPDHETIEFDGNTYAIHSDNYPIVEEAPCDNE